MITQNVKKFLMNKKFENDATRRTQGYLNRKNKVKFHRCDKEGHLGHRCPRHQHLQEQERKRNQVKDTSSDEEVANLCLVALSNCENVINGPTFIYTF